MSNTLTRVVIGLLLAATVALALTGPARAEGIPYAEIETSTVRLDQIAQDSKIICWKAMAKPSNQIGDYIESQGQARDYNQRDLIILFMMCEVYREGASDGIRVANAARTNRT